MSQSTRERELVSSLPTGLFIGGEWIGSSDKRTFGVRDPATGAVLTQVADATPEDGIAALDAADGAFASWASTPARVRAEILRRAFDLLQQRRDEAALLMTLEMGKPLPEAYDEVAYGGEFLRWYSETAAHVQGRYGSNPEGTGRIIVTQHPVGPCFAITPWNFPLAMATRKIAPALAAGCTIVLKPSELTPLTTLYLTRIFQEAGLPGGVLNVVTTTASADVSSGVIADRRLRKLSFTGSTSVGVKLAQQAAPGMLRTSMELGGNAPFIVFEDADLDKAVDAAMLAKFRNIGQACTAANRFIVHRSIVDEFVRRIAHRVSHLTVGRGVDENINIGPLIDERAIAKTQSLVDDAVRRGANVVAGGSAIEGRGSFFEPTVLDHVHPNSDLLREEIFGPVLAVTSFDEESDAVRLANATDYGLVSYVFTENLTRAQRMMELLRTGMMGLNVGAVSNAAAPFGGWQMSGLGREGGEEGIREYLQSKYTLSANPFS